MKYRLGECVQEILLGLKINTYSYERKIKEDHCVQQLGSSATALITNLAQQNGNSEKLTSLVSSSWISRADLVNYLKNGHVVLVSWLRAAKCLPSSLDRHQAEPHVPLVCTGSFFAEDRRSGAWRHICIDCGFPSNQRQWANDSLVLKFLSCWLPAYNHPSTIVLDPLLPSKHTSDLTYTQPGSSYCTRLSSSKQQQQGNGTSEAGQSSGARNLPGKRQFLWTFVTIATAATAHKWPFENKYLSDSWETARWHYQQRKVGWGM